MQPPATITPGLAVGAGVLCAGLVVYNWEAVATALAVAGQAGSPEAASVSSASSGKAAASSHSGGAAGREAALGAVERDGVDVGAGGPGGQRRALPAAPPAPVLPWDAATPKSSALPQASTAAGPAEIGRARAGDSGTDGKPETGLLVPAADLQGGVRGVLSEAAITSGGSRGDSADDECNGASVLQRDGSRSGLAGEQQRQVLRSASPGRSDSMDLRQGAGLVVAAEEDSSSASDATRTAAAHDLVRADEDARGDGYDSSLSSDEEAARTVSAQLPSRM
jgi:hypothetical protein